MCCFSGPVTSVHDTHIFARSGAPDRQFLVYQMEYQADAELAMVLPLPTPHTLGERALRFISLEGYPRFFADLRKAFPNADPFAGGVDTFGGAKPRSAKLKVHDVGSFSASFVPTIADFDRLDERFRLPPDTWEAFPAYQRFGFAVFKLKPDSTKVHPMALEFYKAVPDEVFFPTVHIHDGQIHPQESFDHALYLQGGEPHQQTNLTPPTQSGRRLLWRESEGTPVQFMKAGLTQGIVDPGDHVYQLILRGDYLNRDLWVVPEAA